MVQAVRGVVKARRMDSGRCALNTLTWRVAAWCHLWFAVLQSVFLCSDLCAHIFDLRFFFFRFGSREYSCDVCGVFLFAVQNCHVLSVSQSHSSVLLCILSCCRLNFFLSVSCQCFLGQRLVRSLATPATPESRLQKSCLRSWEFHGSTTW